jgi:hypothetical protein
MTAAGGFSLSVRPFQFQPALMDELGSITWRQHNYAERWYLQTVGCCGLGWDITIQIMWREGAKSDLIGCEGRADVCYFWAAIFSSEIFERQDYTVSYLRLSLNPKRMGLSLNEKFPMGWAISTCGSKNWASAGWIWMRWSYTNLWLGKPPWIDLLSLCFDLLTVIETRLYSNIMNSMITCVYQSLDIY